MADRIITMNSGIEEIRRKLAGFKLADQLDVLVDRFREQSFKLGGLSSMLTNCKQKPAHNTFSPVFDCSLCKDFAVCTLHSQYVLTLARYNDAAAKLASVVADNKDTLLDPIKNFHY